MSAPAQPEAPNHFDLPPERFEEAVADGLDAIPPELTDLMDNVVILIEDEARPADRDHPILGLYEGVPLTERGHSWASGSLPDRITLFRRPLLDFARQVDDEAPD
ncbi:MAG: metallopeptidase family protein, partial [Promicromonosporaceae bacterium]|nr:metallopeptidase family protein [Promicromonosporaceae bacterium]